ncbi:Protein-associating with the carboxyl-terminal domain of ezrin [Blyttiomyces sp. JEL0837]|nr:Protein-associating with the carboxyl-terminal domain of ezrin [Blyttiomyces sp. JEL0837]
MGAAESTARAQYQLQDQVPWEGGITGPRKADVVDTYTLHNATHKSTGELTSIFICKLRSETTWRDGSSTNKAEKAILSNALQRLKTLRHPGIIKFKESFLDENAFFLVTERVTPLTRFIKSLPDEEVAIGIYNLLKTVGFLHANQLCHNNIQLSSLFLGGNNRVWLLGGMEFVTPVNEITKDFISKLQIFLPDEVRAPEDVDKDIPASNGPQARDLYALGNLLTVILAPFVAPQNVVSGELFCWRELQSVVDRMMSRNPNKRPTVNEVLGHRFFADNPLICTVESFLRDIRALPMDKKRDGFVKLADTVRKIPQSTMVAYVLPKVLRKELFAEPGIEVFFAELFSSPNETRTSTFDPLRRGLAATRSSDSPPLVPPTTYKQYVLPFIAEMLKVREYDVRLVMLRLIDHYFISLIDDDYLFFQKEMIPELILGLEEDDEDIYIHSFRAISLIIPKLCDVESNKPIDSNSVSQGSPVRSFVSPSSNTTTGGSGPPAYTTSSTSPNTLQVPSSKSPNNTLSIQTSLSTPSHSSHNSPVSPPPVSLQALVDKHLISHILNICISTNVSPSGREFALHCITQTWKVLCYMEKDQKAAKPLVRNIMQCFSLVFKVLHGPKRINFLAHTLMGDMSVDQTLSAFWVPKVLEFLIPFLSHEDREFRQAVVKIINKAVAFLSSRHIPDSSEEPGEAEETFARKLYRVYGRLPKTRNLFPHSGPKQHAHSPTDFSIQAPHLPDVTPLANEELSKDCGKSTSTSDLTRGGAKVQEIVDSEEWSEEDGYIPGLKGKQPIWVGAPGPQSNRNISSTNSSSQTIDQPGSKRTPKEKKTLGAVKLSTRERQVSTDSNTSTTSVSRLDPSILERQIIEERLPLSKQTSQAHLGVGIIKTPERRPSLVNPVVDTDSGIPVSFVRVPKDPTPPRSPLSRIPVPQKWIQEEVTERATAIINTVKSLEGSDGLLKGTNDGWGEEEIDFDFIPNNDNGVHHNP